MVAVVREDGHRIEAGVDGGSGVGRSGESAEGGGVSRDDGEEDGRSLHVEVGGGLVVWI